MVGKEKKINNLKTHERFKPKLAQCKWLKGYTRNKTQGALYCYKERGGE